MYRCECAERSPEQLADEIAALRRAIAVLVQAVEANSPIRDAIRVHLEGNIRAFPPENEARGVAVAIAAKTAEILGIPIDTTLGAP